MRSWRILLCAAVLLPTLSGAKDTREPRKPRARDRARVETVQYAALHSAVEQRIGTPLETDAYEVSLLDLNDDGFEDAVILLRGPQSCGSDGCTMMVFQGTDLNFFLRSETVLVTEPVRVAAETNNGWHDLVIQVGGGGAAYTQVRLEYDGEAYPLSASGLQADPTPADELAPVFSAR